jgi:hypothetical protein
VQAASFDAAFGQCRRVGCGSINDTLIEFLSAGIVIYQPAAWAR